MFKYQNLKKYMYSYFLKCFEHMDPFLWNILKFTKKIEMIWWTFDKGKDFWNMVNFHENFVVATLKV